MAAVSVAMFGWLYLLLAPGQQRAGDNKLIRIRQGFPIGRVSQKLKPVNVAVGARVRLERSARLRQAQSVCRLRMAAALPGARKVRG